MKRVLAWCGAVTLGWFGAMMLAAPAVAEDGHLSNDPWAANGDSFIVDSTTVHLEDQVTGDTSVETPSLGLNITSGAEVSVEYSLEDGATCETGEPRVFAFVNGNLNKSVQCDGVGQAETTGTLSFTSADSGLVERVGLVYSRAVGHVILENLTVDGTLILFKEPVEPTPSPTTSATPSPTPSVTESPEPVPATSEPVDKGTLPTTGDPIAILAGAGLGALAVGGGLYALVRWLPRLNR